MSFGRYIYKYLSSFFKSQRLSVRRVYIFGVLLSLQLNYIGINFSDSEYAKHVGL